MSFSAFPHERARPTDEELAATLGPLLGLWERTVGRLREEFDATAAEWWSYGRISGWGLNVKDRRGTLAYLYPQRHGFIVVVNVSNAAADRARAAGLMTDQQGTLEGARPYPKGYTVSTDVCAEEDLELVIRLCRAIRTGTGP